MPYVPRLPPRQHQLEALERIRHKPRRPSDRDVFALLMEMGTGKSKVIVDEFGERASSRDVQDMLLVAPAGCYRNWFDDRGPDDLCELHKHLPPDMWERVVVAPWVSGGGALARDKLAAMIRCKNRPRVMVVNVEAISSVPRALDAMREFLDSSRGAMVVVDESTTIKGQGSKRTKRVVEMGQHPRVAAKRILTGLVSPNSPFDLYSQFEFLDPRIIGFRSFFGFRARYGVLQRLNVGGRALRRQPQVVVGYRNVEELTAKIAPYSFRKLKEECLDLPPKTYLPIREVDMTPEQRHVYQEIRLFAMAKLSEEEYVTASMVLAQRLRMDQVLCGFVADEDGKLHELPENRSAALMEILDEAEGKAIVWTSHDYCVRRLAGLIAKKYGPRSVAQFWGGNRATRGEDERRFKGDPQCRFMVATPAAGGRGNTWTGAGLSVYYNNSDNLEHRLQSEDRNHRDGLASPGGAGRAVYADICVRGTLDYKKIQSLRKKLNIATMINGDNYREWLI